MGGEGGAATTATAEEASPSVLQIVGNARYGGATAIMLAWSRYLVERGWRVDVLCTDERMRAEVADLGGVGLVEPILIPREIDPVRDLRALVRLVPLLRRERYDVVHTYTATPSFVGRLAATVARVPVVVNHQGGWAVNETATLAQRIAYTPLEHLGSLLCTRTICVSEAERHQALRLRLAPSRKLVTIVNGIDDGPIRAAARGPTRERVRRRLGCGQRTVLVGTTGRLVTGKDNASVVEAVATVAQRWPELPVRLVLAGDGDADERERLEELVARRGLGDRVELLGFVDDVPALLAGLDVWVTATLTEGLSMSLLEALASGTPVVATAIPANAEVVTHDRTALLVEVGSPHQIAEAIAELARDRDRAGRLGRAGAGLVADRYSMDRMLSQTFDLYHQLLERASRSRRGPGSWGRRSRGTGPPPETVRSL
jgi:glycosyltransferase involved in cell wall biosynthesis